MSKENGKFGKEFLQNAVQEQEQEPLLRLAIYRSGQIDLRSAMDPKDIVKTLQNLSMEIMFGSFQPAEKPMITGIDAQGNPMP